MFWSLRSGVSALARHYKMWIMWKTFVEKWKTFSHRDEINLERFAPHILLTQAYIIFITSASNTRLLNQFGILFLRNHLHIAIPHYFLNHRRNSRSLSNVYKITFFVRFCADGALADLRETFIAHERIIAVRQFFKPSASLGRQQPSANIALLGSISEEITLFTVYNTNIKEKASLFIR